MRPVNLIPPEDRRGDRAPLRAGPLSYVLLGVLLLAFVGVYLMVTTKNSISEREAKVQSLEETLESAEARADALRSFADFATLERTRTETVATLARSRFDWERVLRELALVVPADVTLSDLSGSVASGAESEGGETGTGTAAVTGAPSLTMTGCASSHDGVAGFVASLRDIDGVTRVGLSSTSVEETAGAAAVPAAGGTGGSCLPTEASFEITVAFDGVAVDPVSGGIIPQPPPAPADDSGVATAEAQRGEVQDSVDDAQDRADRAVDNYLPGA